MINDERSQIGEKRVTLIADDSNDEKRATLIDDASNKDLPRGHIINRMSKTPTVPPKIMFINYRKVFTHSTIVIWCPTEQLL